MVQKLQISTDFNLPWFLTTSAVFLETTAGLNFWANVSVIYLDRKLPTFSSEIRFSSLKQLRSEITQTDVVTPYQGAFCSY